ncbi:MAG: hypothetical protein Q9167_002858 [Letrouitia subvulpina]
MPNLSSTAVAEPPTTSNRRQPVRQTRTNPSRNAANAAPPRASASHGGAQDKKKDAEIGFFPAITHFTDSISALPKEMSRHYSMLKEVDAKIFGPEEALRPLISTALKTPIPPRKANSGTQNTDNMRFEIESVTSGAATADNLSVKSVPSRIDAAGSSGTQEGSNGYDVSRRQLFYKLRLYMNEMLSTLDEKNHVLSTANDCLEKQLARCNSSYPHIAGEISEEARYGSLTHWAYTDRSAERRGATAGERTRRDAAAANQLANSTPAVHEVEGAALRSELRREAMAARKSRGQMLESDFYDSRGSQGANKRGQANAKGRKAADNSYALNGSVGLGIASGASIGAPPLKRRKVEKTGAGSAVGGVPMARAMSSVYGSNAGATRGGIANSKEPPTVDNGKKKGRATATLNGNGRRKANTSVSAANSPSVTSSPVTGTFGNIKDIQRRSPAPSLMQRVPSSRGRQNSAQSLLQETRNRPSPSSSVRATNGSNHSTTVDADKVSALTGRTVTDVKSSMKDTLTVKGEHINEDDGTGSAEMRGGLVVGSRSNSDKSLKREDADTGSRSRPDRSRSISIATRGNNGNGGGSGGNGKVSKTSTPTQQSFSADVPTRFRPARTAEQPKRSHKKGAGLAAQLAAAQMAQDEDGDGSSVPGEDDDEDEDEDGEEPRYCYCNQGVVSFGLRRVEQSAYQKRKMVLR